MFHIFFVNQGYMLVLEPPALGSVYDLQSCIANATGVDIRDQFLFLSGGASLASNQELSTISDIGTDSNPIFFVKRVNNVQQIETVKENVDGINELYQNWAIGVERLDRISSNSPAAINECIELSRKCTTVTETIVRFCANIISEHQYLHQGWMAVIANLDDNITRFQRRMEKSILQAQKLELMREKGHMLLVNFDKIIDTLCTIVIPSSLLPLPVPCSSTSTNTLTDNSSEEVTLFDWISSKDPAYSLNSLRQHVLDHLEKTDDSDLREAQALFSLVQDVAKKSQYRDIGGIDKRLAMLNSKQQHIEGCLFQVREMTSRIIQESAQNLVISQKQRLNEIKQPLKNLHDFALCFINSKDELVKNVSQRFSTWIRQAYQRLHEVNKRVVLFEEKFSGLRQRLDLARQIKEAPNIYMSAVPEVIRRSELKKEFNIWIREHIDKCLAFVKEENRIRQEFRTKLNRHFLRHLFAGMDDQIPPFSLQTPPKIDQNLPNISVTHLSELRKAFPSMKDLLSVGSPRVFFRLAVNDPNTPSSMLQSQQFLRRELSFYDRDRTSNMDAMNRNFSSTNWLGEDIMEISPCSQNNFYALGRGAASFASNTSLSSLAMEMQSPPHELGPLLNEQHSRPLFSLNTANSSSSTIVPEMNHGTSTGITSLQRSSAPIAIIGGNNQEQQSRLHLSKKDQIESVDSNNFSTPEEFGSFGLNSAGGTTGRFMTNYFYSNQPIAFRHSPKITRPSSLMRTQQMMNHPALIEEICKDKFEPSEQKDYAAYRVELEARLTNTRDQLKDLSEMMVSTRQHTLDLQEFVTTYPQEIVCIIREKIEKIYNEKLTSITEAIEKQNATRYAQKIAEIEANFAIQTEKLNAQIKLEEELRKEKEFELSNKQIQLCQLQQEMAAHCKQLERNILPITNDTDQELSIAISSSVIEIKEDAAPPNAKSNNPSSSLASDEEEGITRLSSRSCSTQTKVRNKDMQSFVSLNEIHEGFGALIIWNSQLNAFMAHCSTPKPFPYIVKDGCLERLGIRRPRQTTTNDISSVAPHRTWAFVLVENIELCQIRKHINRYNLPIDSRFYRISVQQMPGEFNAPISSASSIASSKR